MRRRDLPAWVLGAALFLAPDLAPAAAAAAAAAAKDGGICDAATALTPVGLDTASGRVLLAVPPLGAGSKARGDGWLVELAPGAESARAWRDPAAQLRGRFGGSVGPGPVLALRPCGDSCLQPVRWQAGAWTPLGESLPLPSVSTAGLTYDLTGAPWIVIHRAAEREAAGQVKAWAFRLEGREWVPKGHLTVAAVGDLQAMPAPQRKDGVLSGTGLFAASGAPETWVAGLPSLPPAKQGQLIALGGGFAGYLSADGAIYLSGDTGKTWRRSTWTPWGTGTTGIWRQGNDFWVDLPLGDRQGRLQLRLVRPPGAERREAGALAPRPRRQLGAAGDRRQRGHDPERPPAALPPAGAPAGHLAAAVGLRRHRRGLVPSGAHLRQRHPRQRAAGAAAGALSATPWPGP